VAALLLLILTLSSFVTQDSRLLEGEREIVAAVREADMAEAVKTLVAFGPRMGGSNSGERAATWIAGRFSRLGLETETRVDPPLDVTESVSGSVEVHGRGEASERIQGAVPYGFSPSGRARARLALEPVAGESVVLLVDGVPRSGAAPEGVTALLVDGDAVPETEFVRLRFLRRDAEGRLPPKGAVPTIAIPGPAGASLRKSLEEGKRLEIAFEVEAKVSVGNPRTVVARLGGAEAERWILFCAHGDADSGGPGANDNASGVAVVLEIARILAAGRERGLVPDRGVEFRFAIWGTEIHSTRAYLERERTAGRIGGLLGVVNFDQAGYGTGNEALFVEPDDLSFNDRLVRSILAVAEEHAGTPGFPAKFTSNRSLGGTDSYVFSDHRGPDGTGLPSVTVFTSAFGRPSRVAATPGFPRRGFEGEEIVVDFDRTYHTSGDLPENTTDLEPHNMGWCARIATLGALRLAKSSAR